MEIENIKGILHKWRENFERVHMRKPTRKDLENDPNAKAAFEKYSKLTQMNQPDQY